MSQRTAVLGDHAADVPARRLKLLEAGGLRRDAAVASTTATASIKRIPRFIAAAAYVLGSRTANARASTLAIPCRISEQNRTRCASRSSAPGPPASTRPSTCSSARTSPSRSTCSTASPPPSAWSAPASPPTTRRSSRSSACTRRPRPARAFSSSATSRSAATSPSPSSSERYHAIISAYGTATDRRLGIPGEDLPGSHPATEFVAWYNAHPDFADHDFDLSTKRAVVIGNGNVAADVARMLALPRAELDDDRHRRPRDRGGSPSPASRRSSSSAAAAPPRRRSPTPRCASSAS